MFNANNKSTRTISLTTPFSRVSIVELEQVS